MHRIVALTFLDVCEEIHRFLSSIRKDAHKTKLVPFFCLTMCVGSVQGYLSSRHTSLEYSCVSSRPFGSGATIRKVYRSE